MTQTFIQLKEGLDLIITIQASLKVNTVAHMEDGIRIPLFHFAQ